MTDKPSTMSDWQAQSIAQDFMCAVEELATWKVVEARRKLKPDETARRLALKGFAVQCLMRMHERAPPQLAAALDNLAEQVPK